MRIFGPPPEAGVERALNRVLSGKPSALARQLKNDLCKNNLDCTCCPDIILTLWKRQLPRNVRDGIADMEFSKATFEAVVRKADKIFGQGKPTPVVAAVTASLDETQPAIPYATAEVAAVSRGGGRGGRGFRGGGRGRGGRGGSNTNSNNNASGGSAAAAQPRHKGTKHPDLPAGDWKGCQMHFKWGKSAFFCTEPSTCPWKDITAPKPSK